MPTRLPRRRGRKKLMGSPSRVREGQPVSAVYRLGLCGPVEELFDHFEVDLVRISVTDASPTDARSGQFVPELVDNRPLLIKPITIEFTPAY